MCQVYKLRVYENIGYPETTADAQQFAEERIREDIAVLKREERSQRSSKVVEVR